jgi:hypothetical protein
MGVVAKAMEGLTSEATVLKTVMIDAMYLRANRAASNLGLKKWGWRLIGRNKGRREH